MVAEELKLVDPATLLLLLLLLLLSKGGECSRVMMGNVVVDE